MNATLYFSGTATPSKSTAHALLHLDGDNDPTTYSLELGSGTSNVAEYMGLCLGLEKAIKVGVTDITIYGHSELVVNCVNGTWGSKKDYLTACILYARHLLSHFNSHSLEWISKVDNKSVGSFPKKNYAAI